MYKKKNLILFYPSFEKGGVTNILKNLLKNKDSKKFIIHIISSKDFLSTSLKKKNFYFYPVARKINIPFFPQRFISALNGMLVLISLLNKLKEKVIIHSMQSNVAAIIISILKKKNCHKKFRKPDLFDNQLRKYFFWFYSFLFETNIL